jgi:predicted Zn-dependent protease
VAKVGERLVEQSDASKPEDPYREHFEFHLLADDETVNAFALPGGQIFITRALYTKLQNEAQLAGVLGHEMGHVINRHSAQQMAKGQLGQMLTSAVAVGASDPDHRGRGQMAAAAAAMANQMLQLRYSRGDESEADKYGLRYMTQAGYDPQEMLGVMRILKKVGGAGGGPEFLQTHPLPETRLEEIARILEETYPDREGLTKGGPLPGTERGLSSEESDWR